jgi:hypothetical protein
MILRNLIILLIDVALGVFWALESKFAYLGNLFVEPYRSWMGVFLFALVIIWTLLSILITRRWWWASLGVAFLLLAFGAIMFLFPPAAGLAALPNYLVVLVAILVSSFLVSYYAEHAGHLLGYLVPAHKHQVTIQTAAGPFWLIFSLILGFLNALSLYYGWLPTAQVTFLGSALIFRFAMYILFATLGGLLTLSAWWNALASFFFVFISEFLNLFLYTTYASLSQLAAEFAGVFVDPARVLLPALMVVLCALWGLAAGYYAQRYFFLKEGKRAAELERLELTVPPHAPLNNAHETMLQVTDSGGSLWKTKVPIAPVTPDTIPSPPAAAPGPNATEPKPPTI